MWSVHMTDERETGAAGPAFEPRLEDPGLWYERAFRFREAAAVLHEACARHEGLLPVAVYNAAVSLDLLLAAILAEQGQSQDHHDLGRMAARIGVGLAEDQRAALGLFSDVLGRLGRYRAPGGEGARDGSGEEVETVRVLERPGTDGRRSPSFADYLALWETLEREYRLRSPSSF
jgi:HEPN domain-containing protein